MTREAVVRSSKPGAYRMEIAVGAHALVADVPRDMGGEDAGVEPFEILCSSLGACTAITVTMYAKRKQWPLERIVVKVRHERVEGATPPDKFSRDVTFEGALDAEQRARLLDVANKCPVHKTLTAGAKVETRELAAS